MNVAAMSRQCEKDGTCVNGVAPLSLRKSSIVNNLRSNAPMACARACMRHACMRHALCCCGALDGSWHLGPNKSTGPGGHHSGHPSQYKLSIDIGNSSVCGGRILREACAQNSFFKYCDFDNFSHVLSPGSSQGKKMRYEVCISLESC
jgi:hypothetical protein